MPVTRVWTPLIRRGVPVGTQMAWLSISKTGAPLEATRVREAYELRRYTWSASHGQQGAAGDRVRAEFCHSRLAQYLDARIWREGCRLTAMRACNHGAYDGAGDPAF